MTAGRHLHFFLIKIIKMEKLGDMYKIKETNSHKGRSMNSSSTKQIYSSKMKGRPMETSPIGRCFDNNRMTVLIFLLLMPLCVCALSHSVMSESLRPHGL